MYLWVLVVIGTTMYGSKSRISIPEANIQAVNFAAAIHGRKLNGSVIKEMDVDEESSCRFECVCDDRCQSYNFKIKKNKKDRYKCQLNSSDRLAGLANFTEDSDFKYGGIMVKKPDV